MPAIDPTDGATAEPEDVEVTEGESGEDPTAVSVGESETAATETATADDGASTESESQEPSPLDLAATTVGSQSADDAASASSALFDAPAEVPAVHRFRIVHEIWDHAEGAAKSMETSGPLVLDDALRLLAEFGLKL